MEQKENKLVLHKDDEGRVSVNVRFADEDVWLTREYLAEIYATTPQNISLHIGNIYQDEELNEATTRKKFFLVRKNIFEGTGSVSHQEDIEKAEREFEIYREREMRLLETDFDKAVKALLENNKNTRGITYWCTDRRRFFVHFCPNKNLSRANCKSFSSYLCSLARKEPRKWNEEKPKLRIRDILSPDANVSVNAYLLVSLNNV